MHAESYTSYTVKAPGKKRIYVVDDEQVIARTLCIILEMFGYEASMFFSAESALEAVQQAAPDLILSDIVMMGEMNGVELAELLAKTHPFINVMLISGQGLASDACRSAQKRGFSPEVRMKPIAPRELLARIEVLLGPREDKPVRRSWPLNHEALVAANSNQVIGI